MQNFPQWKNLPRLFLLSLVLTLFNSGLNNTLFAQGPLEFDCASCSQDIEATFSSCPHTSTLWSNNARHIPRADARSIYVHANFIIVRKSDDPNPDVQGNFSQNNPEHMAYLNEIVDECNYRLRTLDGTSSCGDLATDSKIQIIPHFIFIKDQYAWNADNDPSLFKCPSGSPTWFLTALDNQINADPAITKGINIFLTNQGDIYNQLVTLGSIDNPDIPGYCKWWCSEQPTTSNLLRSSRIHLPNMYLKYRWFQLHPEVTGAPFSISREWLINEARRSLPHELGHSFITDYVHYDNCTNHLMTTGGGTRNVLRKTDVGCMHRNLARTNLRQFVDCTEVYNQAGSHTSDRIVDTPTETWDLNMRLYTNVVVKTGSTLTITCEVLMPYDGTITVEKGAKLVIDGGKVTRANTCSPSQYWRGVLAIGDITLPQPDPNGALNTSLGGVVVLKGNGMIEGAVIGVATKDQPVWYNPQFCGAVVDVNGFTFRDCRKGAEFLPYDLTNRSKFTNVLFERTATGTSQTGVSIWDTDGLVFEQCTMLNMAANGIVSWDAVFNVKKKNRISGSEIGILAGASNPLNGQIQVGELGAVIPNRNLFSSNIVGIKATANCKVEIFSNDFNNLNFDVAINGTTQSKQIENNFAGATAGNQFESTGDNSNENLCNNYSGVLVGTNIVGRNTGFLFRQEDFATQTHDLFIEGPANNPGAIQMSQGTNSGARWNQFTSSQPENIKTSTVVPNNNVVPFFYFHPNPAIDARLKPTCASNDVCAPHSLFTNTQTTGSPYSNCIFPPPAEEPCRTKPCLDAVRIQIAQKTAQYNMTHSITLLAEIQSLVTLREYIVDALIREYRALNNWAAVEVMLNEDLNPANRRRMVGAKLEQKQFSAANALLTTFPQNTLDDQYFVQTQVINTARLNNTGTYVLNSGQESALTVIAESSSPEAGYAQSLLGILTGRVFMPKLPNLESARNDQNAEQPNFTAGLQVSPNPVSDVLKVQLPESAEKTATRILDLREIATGRLVQSIRIGEENSTNISVETLPAGLYLLTFADQGVVIARQKIVVQH